MSKIKRKTSSTGHDSSLTQPVTLAQRIKRDWVRKRLKKLERTGKLTARQIVDGYRFLKIEPPQWAYDQLEIDEGVEAAKTSGENAHGQD